MIGKLKNRKMSTNVYTQEELRYFRLSKGVINHSTAALREVFKQEWNYLYPSTPWRDDGTSGSQMLLEEQQPWHDSRLFDPTFSKDYQAIRNHLQRGNIEEWDVTTLVFALLHSYALEGVRDNSPHWRKVENAIHEIKSIRNKVLSHASKASIDRHTFLSTFCTLEQAVADLLTTTDPLVAKLQELRIENEFVTDEVVKYKKLLEDDHYNLLLLDSHLERLEEKLDVSIHSCEKGNKRTNPSISSAEKSQNDKIVSRSCRRVDRLEHKLIYVVDAEPSQFKPPIFHSRSYIRMINESSSMSYNFQWEDLHKFLQEFHDSTDMKMFADIQYAVALSHQSRKDESFESLNILRKNLLGSQYG